MSSPRTTSRTLPGLGEHLQRIGEARTPQARLAAFTELARDSERSDAVEYLLIRLLARGSNGQRFALEVAALFSPPLPANQISVLADLIENERFPGRLRVAVSGNLLNSVPNNSLIVERIIDALRQKVSPGRAASRLRRLAVLCPQHVAIVLALAELDRGRAAPCPRCGAKLGPDELARHLWEKHRLLSDDGRVREPWDLVGQWTALFSRTNRPEFLDRSCELAQALDPSQGLTRVHRLLLLGGSNEDEARALLRSEATEQHATLCPQCFAMVSQPSQAMTSTVLISAGQVEGGRYRVELDEGYLINRLLVETPETTLHLGPEPGHTLTRRGAVLLFLIPLMGLACVFAVLPPLLGIAPVIPVAALMFAAIIAYLFVSLTWENAEAPSERAIDHAWTMLVPRLLSSNIRRADAAFLAGFARACRGLGEAELREDPLRRAITLLGSDRNSVPYLTPLSALRISDATKSGADDLPLISDEVGDCLDGKLSLDHAERLVNELRGDPIDRTRRVRLRILILARAFAAGLEAEDLRIIGQICPTLGSAYASEDRDGLSRLKLLWLYRPKRMWQRIGSATTVFDLARYPKLAENYLRQRPDLLLFQASAGGTDAYPILICEEGIVYRDSVITERDERIHIRSRSIVRGGGHEMTIGDRVYKFRDDPTLLARRLKGWAEFLFEEFLPRARVLARRRSEQGDRLFLQKAVTCPECRKVFLGLTGEIGFTAVPPANAESP